MMKTTAFVLLASMLPCCGVYSDPVPSTSADAGSPVVDGGVAPPTDTGVAAVETYPAGPYGSSVGRLFRPFTLTACNQTGDEVRWQFDGPEFFTNQLTVISIVGSGCCQRDLLQIQSEIIDRYIDQRVRFIQVFNVFQTNVAAAGGFSECHNWVTRNNITWPVVMDLEFNLAPFIPEPFWPAVPIYVIVDRCGRVRWMQSNVNAGLSPVVAAIDEVLADPRYPACPID
jgi:hypothetical protein